LAGRSFRLWFPSAAATAATLTLAVRPFYAAGPPAARTGGFSEPTCAECHHDSPLNAPDGRLSLDSLPVAGFRPGQTYDLWVSLSKPGMTRAGFQLAARIDESAGKDKQAGTVTPVDDRTQFVPKYFGPVQYLEHSHRGTELLQPDSARWRFRWTAPTSPVPVVFHVAANAANNDNSELGDFIYIGAFRVVPVP
jgi:hypothetical protein